VALSVTNKKTHDFISEDFLDVESYCMPKDRTLSKS